MKLKLDNPSVLKCIDWLLFLEQILLMTLVAAGWQGATDEYNRHYDIHQKLDYDDSRYWIRCGVVGVVGSIINTLWWCLSIKGKHYLRENLEHSNENNETQTLLTLPLKTRELKSAIKKELELSPNIDLSIVNIGKVATYGFLSSGLWLPSADLGESLAETTLKKLLYVLGTITLCSFECLLAKGADKVIQKNFIKDKKALVLGEAGFYLSKPTPMGRVAPRKQRTELGAMILTAFGAWLGTVITVSRNRCSKNETVHEPAAEDARDPEQGNSTADDSASAAPALTFHN